MCPGDKFHDLHVSGTNFGKAAADYASFRAGFPDDFFDRLIGHRVGLPKQRIVDLGTGTGTLARGFASRACRVIGVDTDERMLTEAEKLAEKEGLSIDFIRAAAEDTGLEASSADVVTAGQCWHWFDRPVATLEAQRLLVHGGKLVIAHFDWLPLAGNVVEATERLIEAHNPEWNLGGGRGIHSQWLPGLGEAGMQDIETFSFDIDVPYSPEAWRGRIRASAGVAALSAGGVRRFDDELAGILADRYPSGLLQAPHRVFAIIAMRG